MPAATSIAGNASPTSRVAVVGSPGSYGVIATAPFAAGDVLFRVEGLTTDRPSRYSVQIDDRRHIEVEPDTPLDQLPARYPWRFVNHSCNPSAVLVGSEFLALRAIAVGEAVTYNYNTTELDMAAPFPCHCGAEACSGHISGFAHLTGPEQTRLRPWLAPHLRRRLQPERPTATM